MRFLTVLLVLTVFAAPAWADVPSGAVETTPLADLIVEADAEISFYEMAESAADEPIPLPADDMEKLMAARMLRADEYIGFLRARANDFVHAAVPGAAADILVEFDGAADPADISSALDASTASSSGVWAAEQLVGDWIGFQQSVERLRVFTRSGSPERVCPVDGHTYFRNEWAVPRPWGRIHKGVDMHAPLGTPLVAVEDGVVIQANWHYLGGRQVYLKADSTGDVYYYAHLESWPKWLWTGTRLEAGDYLGTAGDSGDAVTPHLHLGWMPGSESVELANLQNAYYLMFELCN